MENMTTVDLGIVAFILFLSLKGLFNGFMKELFGLIGIVGGVFVGTRLGHEAGMYINENLLHLENGSVISVTGFLASLILFWVGMTILGNILSALTNKSGLGLVNRILGFAFSGLKISMIVAIVVHALLTVEVLKDSTEEHVAGSQIVPPLQEIGAYLVDADFSAVVSKAEEKTGLELEEPLKEIGEAISDTVDSAKEELSRAVEKEVEGRVDEVVDSVSEEIPTTSEEGSAE
jgi:membrane protein required for colicin V production